MIPANNVSQSILSKKEEKKLKKQMQVLQNELADAVLETMKAAAEPLDLAGIIAAFPDNERRRSCKNEQELKLYISMGLGKLIQDGSVKALPVTADGKHLLAVV